MDVDDQHYYGSESSDSDYDKPPDFFRKKPRGKELEKNYPKYSTPTDSARLDSAGDHAGKSPGPKPKVRRSVPCPKNSSSLPDQSELAWRQLPQRSGEDQSRCSPCNASPRAKSKSRKEADKKHAKQNVTVISLKQDKIRS